VKAARLIAIRDLLSGGMYGTRDLAERLEVPQRAIQRDLLDLQTAPLYTPIIEEGRKYRVNALRECLTPADLLALGLGLSPLDRPLEHLPIGAASCISGKPLTMGYRAAEFVTKSMVSPHEVFQGALNGWISDNEARCFANSAPSLGALLTRQVMVFEDGTYYRPLINVESAAKEDRPCWRDLVRQVWPERKGQMALTILTTDLKKRLWHMARVGPLGHKTPVYLYDGPTAQSADIDWPAMLDCLAVVERAYGLGFSKQAIRESLFRHTKALKELGLGPTRALDAELSIWRGRPEFIMATLIAQKEETNASQSETV
jgi:hypothetical protein